MIAKILLSSASFGPLANARKWFFHWNSVKAPPTSYIVCVGGKVHQWFIDEVHPFCEAAISPPFLSLKSCRSWRQGDASHTHQAGCVSTNRWCSGRAVRRLVSSHLISSIGQGLNKINVNWMCRSKKLYRHLQTVVSQIIPLFTSVQHVLVLWLVIRPVFVMLLTRLQ